MKKKPIDTKAIANELAGASAYFAPPKKIKPVPEEPSVRTHARTDVRPDFSKYTPPKSRMRIRHPFNIYADQLNAMHEIQLKAVQADKKKPTLANMVTTAIDDFLRKHYQKKKA